MFNVSNFLVNILIIVFKINKYQNELTELYKSDFRLVK